jgi:hypothetical protein
VRRKSLILALALVTPLVVSWPAAAQQRGDALRGTFSMSVHMHSSEFGGPSGAGTLFQTDPLSFPPSRGSFSYSSIPCNQPAPFNDFALRFEPGYPGVATPAAVRHFLEGTVTPTTRSADRGIVRGTITTILCQGGVQQPDRLLFTFLGRYRLASDNQLVVTGSYRLAGGTGRFAGISGGGSLEGELTCLPPILQREGATNCADLGVFSDAIFRLRGNFLDPSVPTV